MNLHGKSTEHLMKLRVLIYFKLFMLVLDSCRSWGRRQLAEIRLLSDVDSADQTGDILKHPICESFLHLKWLLIRKVFG